MGKMYSLLQSLVSTYGSQEEAKSPRRLRAQKTLSDLRSNSGDMLGRRTSDPLALSSDPTKICITTQQFVLNTCSDPQAVIASISSLPLKESTERFLQIGKRLQTIGKLVATFVSLTAATTIQDLEASLSEKLQELLFVNRVTLFRYNQDTGILTGRDETGLIIKGNYAEGITGLAAKSKLTIICNDISSNSHFFASIDETVVKKTKNIMCVPILGSDGNLDGVLQLCNNEHDFTEYDEFLAMVLSPLLRILIQHLTQRDKLHKKVIQCNNLLHISKVITSELDTGKVVESILTAVRKLVSAERASFFQVDYENEKLTTTIESKQYSIPLQSGVVGRAVTTARSINVTDTAEYPFWDPSVDKKTGYHTKSMLTVPILSDREARVIGVIQMINKIDGDCFSTDDLEILESFGHFASISLNNSKVYGNSLMKERTATKLLNTFKELSSTLKLDETLAAITEQVRSLLGADRGTVFLVDREKQELWSTVIEGMNPIRIPIGKGIAGHVAQTGETVNISDVYNDSRFYSHVDTESGYKTNNMLCVPIFNSLNIVIGVAQMINKDTKEGFTQDDERLASAFAKDASIFIEKSKIYEQAKVNEQIASAEAKRSQERYMDLETKVLMKVISDRARILSDSTSCTLFLLNSTGTAYESIDNSEKDIEATFISTHFNPNIKYYCLYDSTVYVLYYPIQSEEIIGILKLVSDNPFPDTISSILQEIGTTASNILRNTFYSERFLNEAEKLKFLSMIHSKAIKTSQLFQQTAKMHNYLQTVLSTIEQLVFSINSKGKFIQANHQLERFGFSSDVVTTLPVTEWANHSDPNNEKFFKQLIECHTEHQAVYHSLFEFYISPKSSKFIRYSIVPLINKHDKLGQGTVIIIEDITTNKKLNQSLEIFQSSALGLISPSFNPSLQIQSLLRMMLKLLSGRQIFLFNGETQQTMQLLHQISDPDSEAGAHPRNYIFSFDNNIIEQAIETCNLVFVPGNVASSALKKSVKPSILCSPLLVADHVCGVVYLEIFSCITKLSSSDKRIFLVFTSVLTCYLEIKKKLDYEMERLRAKSQVDGVGSNQELLELKNRALESEKAKASFLMNMSHELRTPLNAVIGTAELLLITELNNQQKQFVNAICKSGNALLSVIDDILDFSKVDTNQIVLDIKPFDLRTLIEDEIEARAATYADKNIEICLDMNPVEITSLQGDSHRLRQIFSNLIGNACKFSHPNSQVSVIVTRVASPINSVAKKQNRFHFRVIDHGVGISVEAQERLFKPFSQVDSSTTRKFAGSGLGLVICKHLVQLMNGEMFVQSSLGRGTQVSFCCAFPIGNVNSPSAPISYFPDKTNLLLISSFFSRKILASMLEQINFSVFSFESLHDYYYYMKTNPFDSLQKFSFIVVDHTLLDESFIMYISNYCASDTEFISIARKADSIQSTNKIIFVPLRLKQVYSCFAPRSAASSNKENSEKTRKKHYNALVVEDNTVNQKVLMKQLERIGVVSQIAENGEIGVEMFQKQVTAGKPYDIIFMDCHMPVMDGYEATQKIRLIEQTTKQTTPIIALTADALTGTRDACFAVGMDGYYTKPLRHKDFEEIFTKYLPS